MLVTAEVINRIEAKSSSPTIQALERGATLPPTTSFNLMHTRLLPSQILAPAAVTQAITKAIPAAINKRELFGETVGKVLKPAADWIATDKPRATLHAMGAAAKHPIPARTVASTMASRAWSVKRAPNTKRSAVA
jgi:hypothetical protein